jgi:hypothetical protein
MSEGPLILSAFSLFIFTLFLFRLMAPSSTRSASAVLFIFIAIIGNPIIQGFNFSQDNPLGIGELNTIFSYLMLMFAFMEVLLQRKNSSLSRESKSILVGLFTLAILFLIWVFSLTGSFQFSQFIPITILCLIFWSRPVFTDLRYLPYLARVCVCLLVTLALFKYQSPNWQFGTRNFGVDGPYHNALWDVFGLIERYRGPYQHPNAFGMQITLISSLLFLKKSLWNAPVMFLSFVLLALCASRTSFLALTSGLLFYLYLNSLRSRVLDEFVLRTSEFTRKTGKYLWKKPILVIPALLLLWQIFTLTVGENYTLSGRTVSYATVFNDYLASNVLIGRGPSVFNINGVENTVITLLSYYGLLGLIAFLLCILPTFFTFRKIENHIKPFYRMIQLIFVLAGLGEYFLTGEAADPGFAYVLILFIAGRTAPILREKN